MIKNNFYTRIRDVPYPSIFLYLLVKFFFVKIEFIFTQYLYVTYIVYSQPKDYKIGERKKK